jgi:NADPH:quinone reductase-like Zn-dependent oxidoreductase
MVFHQSGGFMKKVILESFGLDGLRVVDDAVVEPGPGEVRVRWQAASLNYHDLAAVMGMANPRMPLPQVPLSDGAGVVEAVAADVTGLTPGDVVTSRFFPDWQAGRPTLERLQRVTGETCSGVLRQQQVVTADALLRAPQGMSIQQASTLPCAALTAWRALVVEGKVQPGQRVLIQGSGGVSHWALVFARLLGARTYVTSSSDEKLEQLAALGADELFNYRTQPEWGRAVRRATGGEGVDMVVEVGGAGTLAESLNALAIGGHVSMIGVLTGIASTVPTARIMALNATVKGITVGHADHQRAMYRALDGRDLSVPVSHVLPMADVAEALALMQSGAHFGKICLKLGDS